MNEYINIAEMMYQLTEYFSLSTSILKLRLTDIYSYLSSSFLYWITGPYFSNKTTCLSSNGYVCLGILLTDFDNSLISL